MSLNRILFWALSVVAHVNAYTQLTIPLKEVVVTDYRLIRYSDGYRTRVISDSLPALRPVLAAVLPDESLAFVRENGLGMVSSISLRGTTASQTSVIWNGINVNSPLNGQVDPNNWMVQAADSWVLRLGGGSVLFGSGAIGGSLHLDNRLGFERPLRTRLDLGYGSFGTRHVSFRQEGGVKKWSLNWGIQAQDSDNNYPIVGTDLRNQNGEFNTITWNLNAAHRISRNSKLSLYHMGNRGDRFLSGTLLAPSDSRYKDTFVRTQLSFETKSERYESIVRLAHLFEEYSFLLSRSAPPSGGGNVQTYLGRYEGTLNLGQRWSWQHFVQWQHFDAMGVNIDSRNRTDISLSSLLKYQFRGLAASASIRRDMTTIFNSPLLFALEGKQELGSGWKMKGNFSRNFRAPTINDLYWTPGGNPDLDPEESVQWDAALMRKTDKVQWEVGAFWIRSRDLIRWLPGQDPSLWSPVNTERVWIQGFETSLDWAVWNRNTHTLKASGRYGFTRSIDQTDNQQLPYTPRHLARLRIDWQKGPIHVFIRQVYTGSVLTNGPARLDSWMRSDAGLFWSVKGRKGIRYSLGIQVRNLVDHYYELIAFRPMPGRNLSTQLTISF